MGDKIAKLKKSSKFDSIIHNLLEIVEVKRVMIADVNKELKELESKLDSYRFGEKSRAHKREMDEIMMESDKVLRELEITRAEITGKKIELIDEDEIDDIYSEIEDANSPLEDLQEKLGMLGFTDVCPDDRIREMKELKKRHERRRKELKACIAKH